jgi:hypothetical protein
MALPLDLKSMEQNDFSDNIYQAITKAHMNVNVAPRIMASAIITNYANLSLPHFLLTKPLYFLS